MSNALAVERLENVTVIRFNRPEIRSPLSVTVLEQLDELIDEAALKVLIFTGVSDVFASGADLREIAEVTAEGIFIARPGPDEQDHRPFADDNCSYQWILFRRSVGSCTCVRQSNRFAQCIIFTSRSRSWHHHGLERNAAAAPIDRRSEGVGDVYDREARNGRRGSQDRTRRRDGGRPAAIRIGFLHAAGC